VRVIGIELTEVEVKVVPDFGILLFGIRRRY
jgi:hypothetical protein